MLVSIAVALSALLASPLHAPQAIEARQVHVSGVFLNEEAQPVPGVEVNGRVARGDEFAAHSDAHGRFSVVAQWTADVREPRCILTARHPHFSRWSLTTSVRAGERVDVGPVVLEPGGVLKGRVIAENGTPLQDARIWVIDAGAHGPPEFAKTTDAPSFDEITDKGASDHDGAFRIVGVPPGRWYAAVRHETTYWHASEVVTLLARAEVELATPPLATLPDEYRIEGVVLDAVGGSVAKALVETQIRASEGDSMLGARATTREDGSFQLYLPRLVDEALDIEIRSPNDDHDDGHVTGIRPGARNVVIRLGAMRDLNVFVLDEDDRPVEEFGWNLRIDKPGRILYTGSRPEPREGGHATLRVPNYPLRLEIRTLAYDNDWVALEAGSLPELVTIRLNALEAITGRVTFHGEPMPDIHVELVRREPNRLKVVEGHWSGLYYGFKDKGLRTDQEGRFLIPNDHSHLTYHVRAWAPGYAPGLSAPVKVGEPPVDVALGEGGSIEGVVLLPDGVVPAGVKLEALRRDPPSRESDVGRILRAETDETGHFRFDHLSDGAWLVRTRVSGSLAAELGWSEELRKENEVLPFVATVQKHVAAQMTIDLNRETLCRLEGQLTVGDKVREGYCKLLLEGSHALKIAFGGVDTEGRFQLAAREPGTYRLAIHAGPGHHQYKVVTDLVRLEHGVNEWIRNLPAEQWQGEGIRLDPE